MADKLVALSEDLGISRLFRDMGDGTYAEGVYVVNPGSVGSGGSSVDRELVQLNWRCKTAFTGASVGDAITETQIVDVTSTPTTVSTLWRNQTTGLDLASAPLITNLDLIGNANLTNAELRASPIIVNANNNVLQSASNTSVVQLAAGATFTGGWDGASALLSASVQVMVLSNLAGILYVDQAQNTAGTVGVDTEQFAVTAGVPYFANVAIIGKAVRVRFTNSGTAATTTFALSTILTSTKPPLPKTLTQQGNLKVSIQELTYSTPGLLPVDTLATPAVPRVLATSASSQNIALTPTCRRVSMYATQGTWYSISGTATATSHYIGTGERLDFDVPASTTIAVLQETTAGSIRITELS